jgi:hypothetical protein
MVTLALRNQSVLRSLRRSSCRSHELSTRAIDRSVEEPLTVLEADATSISMMPASGSTGNAGPENVTSQPTAIWASWLATS